MMTTNRKYGSFHSNVTKQMPQSYFTNNLKDNRHKMCDSHHRSRQIYFRIYNNDNNNKFVNNDDPLPDPDQKHTKQTEVEKK